MCCDCDVLHKNKMVSFHFLFSLSNSPSASGSFDNIIMESDFYSVVGIPCMGTSLRKGNQIKRNHPPLSAVDDCPTCYFFLFASPFYLLSVP